MISTGYPWDSDPKDEQELTGPNKDGEEIWTL